MRSSVCIEMIFTEVPFLHRFAKAVEAGYDAVEFWSWDNKDMPAAKQAAADAGIQILTFQSNRGGTLINPEQRSMMVDGIRASLDKAQEMGVKSLFLLTDELGEDRSVRYQFPELSPETKRASMRDGLAELAQLAEEAGVMLNLEVLNTRVDHAGYWLAHVNLGYELIREVNSPNLRLLFDCYHVQIMDGNLIPNLTKNIELLGHVHVADAPGRHEPGTGEINYANVFKALKAAGYDRYVGMEFAPTNGSDQAAREAMRLLKEA